ncbi:hypothetical protein OAS39_12715, partial [Pirellulales bacterium]|nr:hypothetical protein [Pirellulales bacterium]
MMARRILFVVPLLFGAMPSAWGLNIIWVSEGRSPALADAYSTATAQGWNLAAPTETTPYDQGFVNLLTDAGHTVDYRTSASTGNATTDWESNGFWQGDLTEQQQDDLSAADLVIISPDLNGANYGDVSDTTRRDTWNSIATPMLSLTPQTLTTDVFGWMSVGLAAHIKEVDLTSSEPRYMRALLVGPDVNGDYGLRDSNESVQFDFLDEQAGSKRLSYVNQNWGELLTSSDPPPEDKRRTFAVTGEETFNNNAWIAPSGKSYIQWHTRWEAGQDWYCSPPGEQVCSPPSQALPGGPRQMFIAAGAENTNVGGFYVGAGVENLTHAGEVRLLDTVDEITAQTQADLRKNREIPKFTPTIDGSVSQSEIDAQTEVSMIFPISGGSIIESTFVENMQGFTEERLSAKWYVSWDDDNLYITAAVKDDSPIYTQIGGGTFINQDSVQFNFNPNDTPEGTAKRAYDAVVQTADSAGPSVERSGGVPVPAINLVGQETADGYILEMA